MLAQWATDAYYKVVITKNQGIPTICQAMQVYANNQSIQRSGCTALLLLAASQQAEYPLRLRPCGTISFAEFDATLLVARVPYGIHNTPAVLVVV